MSELEILKVSGLLDTIHSHMQGVHKHQPQRNVDEGLQDLSNTILEKIR